MPHAPGHIRDAFDRWIEDGVPDIDGEPVSHRLVIGQLWNCTDILPGGICDDLQIPLGSTYAQAVRRLAAKEENSCDLSARRMRSQAEIEAAGADAFRDLWERRDMAGKSQRKNGVAVLSEPNTYEHGFASGKLAALRWVVGMDWKEHGLLDT